MIIVGLTAIFAGQTLDITPYPFARDCVFFNIFLGLGLPWLIYTAVWWTPYTSMQMQDPLALLEPIIILFVYIFLLLGVMLFSGWRLYPKVGYVLILLDLLFIAWSLLTHPLGGAGSTPVIAVNGR